MAFLIDPPGPSAPRRQWEEFLVRLKSLPQDDPGVQAEVRNAELILAPATRREPNDVESGRQQIRQLIKQALETPTAENLSDYLGFATSFRRLAACNTRMWYIQRPGARVGAWAYQR